MPLIDDRSGVMRYDRDRAMAGYTLFTPMGLFDTHLIDMHGKVVHSWALGAEVGTYSYLLDNGNLLTSIKTDEGPKGLPAKGGRLMELDWDGKLVWEHVDHNQHHDFRRLPNGNTLYLAWELLDKETQSKVPGGRAGAEHADGIYGDVIREVDPSGGIVWEWRAAHDMDMARFPLSPVVTRKEYAHANTVNFTPDGDVIVNWRYNHAMAIIDRETKAIKWSLNRPEYGQHHDVQVVDGGNILFFANGSDVYLYGPETGSKIIEVDPKTNEEVWRYAGTPPRSFMSWFISGCQRLANGNTLVCEGLWGRFFEVTRDGEMVWEYVSPYYVDYEHPAYTGTNIVFRCYRYAADGPQIAGRLPAIPS